MTKSDLRIDILGTIVTISTDEEPEYLSTLLNKYRHTVENVQRISGLKDPLKTAILTGFLLSDDLEKAGRFPAEESGEAEELTLGMIARLDEALSDNARAPFTVAEVPAETTRDAAPVSEPAPDIPAAPQEKISGSIFKLRNTVKNYEWGSPEWIPALLGERNLTRVPWAELWMGVNRDGPSRVVLPGESGPLLSELIENDPVFFLGKETAEIFGTLPFLFKVEAAKKPLSIQAHPNREQAREGFERENREGIPRDASNRNYRDSNHKPEIISALTTFAALCGFREQNEIRALLDILLKYSEGALKAAFENLLMAVSSGSFDTERDPGRRDDSYKSLIAALFNLESETLRVLGPFLKNRQNLLEQDFPEYRDEWGLCAYLAALYPEDPGILAPLYLNIVELKPGETMYLPAGVFHAYIHGLGIELMADSDNVLRGGLTSKHVDKAELLEVVNFAPYKPEIFRIPEPAPEWYRYPAPAGEFTLSVLRGRESGVVYPETNPAIVMLTEGNAVVTEAGKSGELELKKGESVFIPAGKRGNVTFSGTFTAYAAAAGNGALPESSGQEDTVPF